MGLKPLSGFGMELFSSLLVLYKLTTPEDDPQARYCCVGDIAIDVPVMQPSSTNL